MCVLLVPTSVWACNTNITSTTFSSTDQTLVDWETVAPNDWCEWQKSDPALDETGNAPLDGRDILGFAVTHANTTAAAPNTFWEFRLAGNPPTAETYRVQVVVGGTTTNFDMNCPGTANNRTCNMTCSQNGANATCLTPNTSRAYQFNGNWVVEVEHTSSQAVWDNSTITASSRNGNTQNDNVAPITNYHFPTYNGSLPIGLKDLAACVDGAGTDMRWHTGSEAGTVGFFVHRDAADGPLVSSSLVRAQLYTPVGADYHVADGSRTSGTYYLEEVTLRGSRIHGPVSTRECSTPASASLPARASLRVLTSPAPLDVTAPSGRTFVDIEKAGIYAVDSAALVAPVVAHGGAPYASFVGADGRVLFYAPAVTAADRRTESYELVAGSHAADATRRVSAPQSALITVHDTPVTIAEHHILNPLAPPERRFPWGYAYSGAAPVSFSFDLPGLVPSATPVATSVSITGMSDLGVPNQHDAAISINGVALGESVFGGLAQSFIAGTIPGAQLLPAGNTITLSATASAGVAYDIDALDFLTLAYPRLLTAVNDVVEADLDASQAIELAGFSAPPVLIDATSPAQAVFLRGAVAFSDARGFGVRFSDTSSSGVRHYVAAVPQAATLRAGFALADLSHAQEVMIYGAGLGHALAPLVALRNAQGVQTIAVPLQALNDSLNHGQAGTRGLRQVVAAAPNLKYIVLVGDASIDPHDYLATGAVDIVPTVVGVTQAEGAYTANDAAFATASGASVPAVALGRLSAKTPTELAAMVAKLIAFEGETARGTGVLVADDEDPETGALDTEFVEESAQFAASLPGVSFARVYRPNQTHDDLWAALANNPDLVTFHGHGNGLSWTTGALLSSDPSGNQLASLPNTTPFLLATATCWDGQFAMPTHDSLAESLVKAPTGGAIAAISPSSTLATVAAPVFDAALTAALANPANRTIGEAWLETQKRIVASANPNSADLLATYNLLGDPATRLPMRVAQSLEVSVPVDAAAAPDSPAPAQGVLTATAAAVSSTGVAARGGCAAARADSSLVAVLLFCLARLRRKPVDETPAMQ